MIKKGLKKGGTIGVRDAPSGQPPRKKRKVEDLDNDLAALHMMRERKVLIISMLMVIVMTMAMHMQEIAEVEMGGGAAKYREEYKQNIGSTERGTDLD
jgi:hypothetical protein